MSHMSFTNAFLLIFPVSYSEYSPSTQTCKLSFFYFFYFFIQIKWCEDKIHLESSQNINYFLYSLSKDGQDVKE